MVTWMSRRDLHQFRVYQAPPPPNGPLIEPLWPIIVGIWGILQGSLGGLGMIKGFMVWALSGFRVEALGCVRWCPLSMAAI